MSSNQDPELDYFEHFIAKNETGIMRINREDPEVLEYEEEILSQFDPEFLRKLKIALKISKSVLGEYSAYIIYVINYEFGLGYPDEDIESISAAIDSYIPSLKKTLIWQVETLLASLKPRIFKDELYEKQTQMMYNPNRIKRLLETGLIDFTDGDWNNL